MFFRFWNTVFGNVKEGFKNVLQIFWGGEKVIRIVGIIRKKWTFTKRPQVMIQPKGEGTKVWNTYIKQNEKKP